MENRLIPILLTVGIILLGFVLKLHRINSYVKRRELTIIFRSIFIEMSNIFFKSGRIPTDLYTKCIHDVDAIQLELGNEGIIADFVDRLHGIQGKNYQLFVNIIPELRTAEHMYNNSVMMERLSQLVCICDDALQRHIGNLDRALENDRTWIFNPFTCFGEGVRFIIGLPIDILLWCGIISLNKRGGWLFKAIGTIITFISLISSIITIVLGWNDASAYFIKLWNLFL